MSGPSVVVERAPDGWTHIGGPGMHLLIGLDEDDERTIAASDAADGGDIDDVVEVLTAGGMRQAKHFVGVHWKPRTRIVAFGPVSALVTLPDGSEHDVRATSRKVWSDVELPEHPERVVLRVLEESERSQPAPPQELTDGPLSTTSDQPADPGPSADRSVSGSEGDRASVSSEPSAVDEPEGGAAQPTVTPTVTSDAGSDPPAAGGDIPTFGAATRASVPAPASDEGAGASDRAGASDGSAGSGPPSPAPAGPRRADEPPTPAAPAAPAQAAAAPTLRSWASVTPPIPVRATPTGAPTRVEAATEPATEIATPTAAESRPDPAPSPALVAPPAPVADDLPVVEVRDVDSTWAARPVLEREAAPSAEAPSPPVRPDAATPGSTTSAPQPSAQDPGDPDDPDDAQPAALPSYDYLFGHTTTADEHRKALAQLTRLDDDEAGSDDDLLSVPRVADVSDAPVTNATPAPQVPERPLPSAPRLPDLPQVSEGGLISSVPWASPAPAARRTDAAPTAPTFSGRHTPPPAPSLLPPMNTPPPGVRAPEATPLISTGPPPASAAPAAPVSPVVPATPSVSAPGPAPAAPSVPSRPAAYAPSGSPEAEPSFDVPISLPPTGPAPASTPAFVPGSSAVPDPAPAAALDDDEDETELTVDRSALLEARNAAQNQAISGPSVLAVLCAAGHPTPPHSDRCRVCGSSIPPQEPFTMSRPPLGVLRLSTGDVVTLDRSVLLGRAPRLGDGLAAHDRPHVVKVPSPERDVSRNHVEVILEGWHVLIRDLGTTNGTTVTLPGESPIRLRANDQQVLEPGSFVSMADEVSFTFEAAS